MSDVTELDPLEEMRRQLMGTSTKRPKWHRPEPHVPTAPAGTPSQPERRRTVHLSKASTVRVRAVRWLWAERLPLGSLSLLGGREGIGKSTAAYTLAADLSRGRLPGHWNGNPRPVIVAATEDSWGHTIAPRLMAADADLELIYRVEVTTAEDAPGGLSLPNDLPAVEQAINETGSTLVLLDPLMSRLDAGLDTHKDSEVRQALEPLTALADRTGAAILGLIHVNKSSTSDPLTSLMGSRAFAAVARAVLYVVADSDDPGLRLLGQAKNNLGRMDLSTLRFRVESTKVADTDEGPVTTGRLQWCGEDARSLTAVLEDAQDHSETRSATSEAGDWLLGYLADNGGTAPSADVKADGGRNGHSYDALKRARTRLGITSTSSGFPRKTYWSLPETQLEQPSESSHGESAPTALTALTGSVGAVSAVGAVGATPRARDPLPLPAR